LNGNGFPDRIADHAKSKFFLPEQRSDPKQLFADPLHFVETASFDSILHSGIEKHAQNSPTFPITFAIGLAIR
jgi:hypothetical protein